MRTGLVLLAVVTAGLITPGCPDESSDQTYSGSARRNYLQGMEAFEDEDYLEAVRLFTFVKNKYTYSKYAALAELRIADAYFEQDKYAEAIDAYRIFTQSRPNHREVPYAMWRIGQSHYEQIPGDFFIFPPSHEKDQAATKDAVRTLQTYVSRFPDHKNVREAKLHIEKCRQMLADHELYVARFYVRDERPQSARGRLELVVRDYEDLPDRWSQAALLLARVYKQLGMADEARAMATRVVSAHPERPEADDARDFMAEL